MKFWINNSKSYLKQQFLNSSQFLIHQHSEASQSKTLQVDQAYHSRRFYIFWYYKFIIFSYLYLTIHDVYKISKTTIEKHDIWETLWPIFHFFPFNFLFFAMMFLEPLNYLFDLANSCSFGKKSVFIIVYIRSYKNIVVINSQNNQ